MPTQKYRNKKGDKIPGTTTIISSNLGWNTAPLMWWAWNEGMEGRNFRETSGIACDIGTIAHEMIACDLKGIPFNETIYEDNILDGAYSAFNAWWEWKDQVGFKLLASELSLVSEKYQYGGTIDMAVALKKRAVIDFKTSKAVYPDHLIQLAAYGQLHNEHYLNKKVEAYYLLRLGKEDPEFAYYYWPADSKKIKAAWEAFLLLRQLHDLKRRLK